MDLILIGEAAAKLQMRSSALRYYDHRGLPLDTAAVVLDAPAERWREAVQEQIAELDRVIGRARGVQKF